MNIFLADEQDEPVDSGPLVRIAERVLTAEGLPADTEVSIILIGPEEMGRYNERFMDRSGPTDVLAFPLSDLEAGHPPVRTPNGPPVSLGDVFICPQVVGEQAAEAGIEVTDEMALIVAHGLLHLLGYDHDAEGQAAVMAARERNLLAEEGIVLP